MNAITTPAPAPADLATLALEINAAHSARLTTYDLCLDHAQRAGELLIDAKGKIPHGAWDGWVKANCRFSTRAARVYAQIARNWPSIDAKRQSLADLTLSKALETISTPKAAISTPSKPFTIEAAAREVTGRPPAPEQSTPATATPEPQSSDGRASPSNLRREPTLEERAKEKARDDLAEYITGSIRAWMRAHPEHDADSAVELASEALAFLKSEIEDGGVKIT